MKILCAGDLHIGRRSSKLPAGHGGPEHACAAAWEAVVDCALAEQVDVVALSGDLVDRANRYFEAVGPLERGLRRLAGAGIETFAVAGNHDFDVLPELVDTLGLERFHLLGRGGQWERHTLTRAGRPALHIDGWSFPSEHVDACALDFYDLPHDGTPTLGILHADLDQPRSRYGPVTLSDLQRRPVALWLLGHIHAGAILEREGAPPVVYPGSPQAMDPGEPGVHGALLVEIEPAGSVALRRLPLSTVCYLTLEVDLSGVDAEEDARSLVTGALRAALTRDAQRYERLAVLSCRLTLTGRTPLHGNLRAILNDADEDLNMAGVGGVEAVIEMLDYQTRPAIELDQLAGRNDPPGEVARIIQAIEGRRLAADYPELLAATVRRLRTIHGSNSFSGAALDPAPDEQAALNVLRDESWALLDALVAQKETA